MFFDETGLALTAQPPDVPELMGIESEYMQTQCILADGGDRFGVCSLTFDRYEELLWMGNQGGHVTSYYTGAMQKYTSFQIHASEDVRQITSINEGILGLTASSLRYQIRRGIPVFTHTSANMDQMQCLLQLSNTRVVMGGYLGKLIDFSLDLCKEVQVVDVGEHGCVMLRPHSRYVCAGNPLGRIDLRDPKTLNVEHTLETHSGSLSDFDVQGNLLVTCGFSNRHGNLNVDRFLMVYDLRMMRAITPIQTVLDPLYLRFLPSISSRLVVVSAMGHAQFLDTVAYAEPRLSLMQMETPIMCLCFDISATTQAVAYGDNAGSIHLFASTPQPLFNNYSRMTEHGDPLVTYPSFAIDDTTTPLSSVPMPICHNLSSEWPPSLMKRTYRRPLGVDPDVLRTMKMKGPIGYAPNPRTTRRNQVTYDLDNTTKRSQAKSSATKPDEHEGGFIAIPKRYRKIDVKYNKMGTDECQFDQFNRTGLTGLEATLPNAYCNAMIQVLYYIEPIRAALLSHLCAKEFCLSCELGFLFHMLKTSSTSSGAYNSPCQPANFLRAFRTIPEASALSLVYSDLTPEQKLKVNLGALIQSWNRFIIHQLHVDLSEAKKHKDERKNCKLPFSYNVTDFPAIDDKRKSSALEINANMQEEKKESDSEIIQLIGAKQLQKHACLKCKLEVVKQCDYNQVCNLIYPTNQPERDEWSFCDILSKSLRYEQVTPAWCEGCKKFLPAMQTRNLQSLPNLLSINTGLDKPQHKQFWQSQMDKMVAKMAEIGTSTPTSATPTVNSLTSSSKPCRYGDHCTRPGCRFRHSFDNVPPPAPVNNPYCSNNWLPHAISISLKHDQLLIENHDDARSGTNKHHEHSRTATNKHEAPRTDSNKLEAPRTDTNKHEVSHCETNKHEATRTVPNNHEASPNHDDAKKDSDNDSSTNDSCVTKVYHLTAVVCFVNDQTSSDKRNIVALINIPENGGNGSQNGPKSRWFLFNDFSISPVAAPEVVWFSLDWKIPCVLYYSTREIMEANTQVAVPISKEVFTEDACIARSGPTSCITFTPLADNEFPRRGDLVAMDAEFVTLNQEEAELRSDGKMSMVKPSQMSVARITCIRGHGPLEGVPFIDDYISTQEQVVDYLTKFSGIKPGDLDANFSSKHLTTLKSTYTKLRFLLDSGVVFVGHGLKNDFRVINLVVPPEQVVDTVHLFHLPHHRMVSLRFLAWHFLGVHIQSETHDSVEDARAALHLYKKYRQLEAVNKVGEALSELYERGKSLNWKVPEDT